MAWGNHSGSHIPPRVKNFVRKRDNGECQLRFDGCTVVGEEFDHIANIASLRIPRSQANAPELLQLVCSACHKKKTQAEAMAGRRKHLRPKPTNPGLA